MHRDEHNVTSIRASKSLLQENEWGLIAHSAPALGCTWALTPAYPDADKAGDLVVALSQVTGRWTWPTFEPVKGPRAVKTRVSYLPKIRWNSARAMRRVGLINKLLKSSNTTTNVSDDGGGAIVLQQQRSIGGLGV